MNIIYDALDNQGIPERDKDLFPYLEAAMEHVEESVLTREQVLFELAGELAFLMTEFWPAHEMSRLHHDFGIILADALSEMVETSFLQVQ